MEGNYYTVKQGDSLWGIAKHFGYSIDALAARNNLTGKQKNLIQIGQKIYMPDGNAGHAAPDLKLSMRVIGLSSKPVKNTNIKLSHDGKKIEAKTDSEGWLHDLHIQDHIKGLKVEFETYDGKWKKIFDEDVLPLGEKILQINILTELLKTRTVRKDGPTLVPDKQIGHEVKKQTPQPGAPTSPRKPLPAVPATPIVMETRTSNGLPTTIVAPLFSSENLHLKKGNEKFRQAIIDAAKRYKLTPHALAAIINAEAAKTKDGSWIETCAAGGSNARGLGQFLSAAWFQYIAKVGTLGNVEALRYLRVSKLAAANGKLYKAGDKGNTEISAATQQTILTWRDNGGYAIDAIGAYAEDNLDCLKRHGIDVSGLPPDEKVKIAYIMHHEGPTNGVLYLNGKLGTTAKSTPSDIEDALVGQFKSKKDDGAAKAKAKALADRFGGDYVKAYYYFLANHTDMMVRSKNFMLNHDGFNERSANEVIQGVAGINIEKPKGKAAQPASTSSKPEGATTVGTAKEVGPTQGVGGDLGWSDPLDRCSIRVGGYANSVENPADARLKSLFNGRNGVHKGIDLDAVPGTPIKAVANGEIFYAGPGDTYGNVILLKVNINDFPPAQKCYAQSIHDVEQNTIYFMYAHLSEISIKTSSKHCTAVKTGQVIGKSGETGNANGMKQVKCENFAPFGAHLHFEVRRNPSLKKGKGHWFDPKPFLHQCY